MTTIYTYLGIRSGVEYIIIITCIYHLNIHFGVMKILLVHNRRE